MYNNPIRSYLVENINHLKYYDISKIVSWDSSVWVLCPKGHKFITNGFRLKNGERCKFCKATDDKTLCKTVPQVKVARAKLKSLKGFKTDTYVLYVKEVALEGGTSYLKYGITSKRVYEKRHKGFDYNNRRKGSLVSSKGLVDFISKDQQYIHALEKYVKYNITHVKGLKKYLPDGYTEIVPIDKKQELIELILGVDDSYLSIMY